MEGKWKGWMTVGFIFLAIIAGLITIPGLMYLIFSTVIIQKLIGVILLAVSIGGTIFMAKLSKNEGKKGEMIAVIVIVSAFLLLSFIIAFFGKVVTSFSNSNSTQISTNEYQNTTPSPSPTSAPTPTPEPTPQLTLGQQNALSKALSYLSHSAFSYQKLIEQLEYEGFTEDEAIYGADHCGADWNIEAAQKAESYMKHNSFSRDRLIEQLKYEGFTDEQAEYGATSVGY